MIKPVFGRPATEPRTRAISSALRALHSKASTPKAGAEVSMAVIIHFSPSGLRSTATRVTFGATSLSVCSHLPPIAGSKFAKPVRLAPRLLRLATTPAPSGSEIPTNTVGMDCVACAPRPGSMCLRQDDFGRRSDERGSVRSEAVWVAGGKMIIDMNVAAFDPTQCRPRGFERFNARCQIKVAHDHADPANASGLLRARRERPAPPRRRAA